ncbi:hypothetical protein WG907_03830 [Sphingobium sp. AN558]|uniref:hypothetical protein n=1 Tax=Sphingobium sp. AN558 TaxID=3133442 RepID=UPI0030C377DC
MPQGEPVGARPMGDIRGEDRWSGPWRSGVRPSQQTRAVGDVRTDMVGTEQGSKIR